MWSLLYHMRCDQYYIIWDVINNILNEMGSILYYMRCGNLLSFCLDIAQGRMN